MDVDYRSLLLAIEDRLGTCHVLVDREAKEPAGLLLATGVHDALTREMARAIYRGNRCYHVRARVSEEPTLRALLPIRARVLADMATDWATAQFLDRFYEAAQGAFAAVRRRSARAQPAPTAAATVPAGRIFSFPRPALVRAV
jgi:hypothetical protein